MKYYCPELKDINNWSEHLREHMIQIYGKDYFQKMVLDWLDALTKLYKKENGCLVDEQVLSKIKCPTLIVHGAKDVIALPKQAIFLKQIIADSKCVFYRLQKIYCYFAISFC